MKKKLATTLLAGALSASMVVPAFATSSGAVPSADGTEVWAGIILEDKDAKVMVEVPTLFAFVVNGSVLNADNGAVTVAGGEILLPNAKVKVTTASGSLPGATGSSAAYSIQYVGDGNMPFTNYSTVDNGGTREGLAVTVNGNIKNEGTPVSRNYWEHTSSTNTTTSDFKKYNVSIDGHNFDTASNGGLQMADVDVISLAAPDLDLDGDGVIDNLNTTTNLAITGVTHQAAFSVTVGGVRNQYKQVEESAKVGTIVWTVSAAVGDQDVYTAPNNDYLDGIDDGSGTDPDGIALQ
ncbi:MAG: hypothetical protein ACRDBO_16875 [Lachnospiraceae bacterium]